MSQQTATSTTDVVLRLVGESGEGTVSLGDLAVQMFSAMGLDIYTFQATPGEVVYFDAQSGNNCGSPLKWRCVDEKGAVLFDQNFGATGPCGPTDPGTIVLSAGGTYTITVSGIEDGTGGYQFQLRSPP